MTATIEPAALNDFERRLGHDLLRGVSRTFYLSLRLLPAQVRGSISLAYLLARTSDTLADSGNVQPARRREALGAFARALQNPPHPADLEFSDLRPDHPTERELLDKVSEMMAWFWTLAATEREIIQHMMTHILAGQTADLERTRLESADELELYTFQVAGCVGQFWTRLCAASLPSYTSLPVEELELIGIQFGKGLQLINILRDVPKDAAAGRCYLPGLSADASPEQRWTAATPWIARCRENLAAGCRYARHIRGLRCRMAVWLPLLLARETLALIENQGPAAMHQPVKVPRHRIKWIMARAVFKALGF